MNFIIPCSYQLKFGYIAEKDEYQMLEPTVMAFHFQPFHFKHACMKWS